MQNYFLKYWFPVIAYALLIFAISSIPSNNLPQAPFMLDRFFHLLEFLLFGVLFARAVKRTSKIGDRKIIFWFSLLFVSLYALSDEVHQIFVPGRHADVFDLIFDGIGGFIGIKLVL